MTFILGVKSYLLNVAGREMFLLKILLIKD